MGGNTLVYSVIFPSESWLIPINQNKSNILGTKPSICASPSHLAVCLYRGIQLIYYILSYLWMKLLKKSIFFGILHHTLPSFISIKDPPTIFIFPINLISQPLFLIFLRRFWPAFSPSSFLVEHRLQYHLYFFFQGFHNELLTYPLKGVIIKTFCNLFVNILILFKD